MSSLVLSGDTSGTVTLSVPAVSGSNTLTIQAGTGTNSMNTLSTSVTCAGQTSIDFTGIPAWVKRITVMFSGVSTNGSSLVLVQLGAGSVTTSGYTGVSTNYTGSGGVNTTNGFQIYIASSASVLVGNLVITNISSNTWVASGICGLTNAVVTSYTAGNIALGGTLDRVRITTVNGTDTFDATPSAGQVNILYEG